MTAATRRPASASTSAAGSRSATRRTACRPNCAGAGCSPASRRASATSASRVRSPGKEGSRPRDRGAKLTLTQTVGGSSSGAADALLARGTLDGLAANDNGEGGNDEPKSRRLELKFGYGLSAFGDGFTWTPEAGIGLSDTGRDYSLGWRLVRGGSGSDGGSLELSFEARRSESANDDTPPAHEVGLRLTARF